MNKINKSKLRKVYESRTGFYRNCEQNPVNKARLKDL